jgi:hypothetical protein
MREGQIRRRRSRLALLGAAVSIASLCVAQAAVAKPREVVAVAPATIPPRATAAVSADAKCPAGLQAVGGGFTSTNRGVIPTPHSRDILVSESYRLDPATWRVTANSGNYGETLTFTAIAYCRRGPPLREATSTAPVGPSPSTEPAGASAAAICPRGSSPLSGGFRASPFYFFSPQSTFIGINESAASGKRAWRVTATRSGTFMTPVSPLVTATAYCVKGAEKPDRLIASVKVPQVQSNPRFTARTKKCPRAPQGGFQALRHPGPPLDLASIEITDSYRAGKTWTTSGFFVPFGKGKPLKLTSIAYCR